MRKLYKTVAMLMVCVVLSVSVFSSANLKVQAAAAPAVPAAAELIVEIALALYGICESGMIVSSADKAIDDYSKSMDAFEAFGNFVNSIAGPDLSYMNGITFTDGYGRTYTLGYQNGVYGVVGPDGTVISMDSVIFGTGARDLIDEDTFANYRVISGGAGDSGDSGEDPDGGDDEDPFTHIEKVTIGNGFLALLGDFIGNLLNGETELNPGVYYTGTEYFYRGDVAQNSSGQYIYRACVSFPNGQSYYIMEDSADIAGLVVTSTIQCYHKKEGSTSSLSYNWKLADGSYALSFIGTPTSTLSNNDGVKYSANFPIFTSKDALMAYLETGDASAALNAPIYDFPDMAESVPEVLHPITGINITPNALLGLNGLLASAADSFDSDGFTTSGDRTDGYIDTMASVVIENLPEELPDSGIEPEPEPGVDPDAGAGEYTGILERILNAIFSIAGSVWSFFKNPMEYIMKGIEALNNGLLRIIEILPEQVGQILGNIVTLPQSIFDLFANPLAGIQNLLSLGNEAAASLWNNLEPYLNDFKLSLQNLAPDPAFDFDGGDFGEDEGNESGGGFKFTMLLDGLIVLILILLMLLSIFLHCLEFIINIFKIPATTGFLPDDMVAGFNYIKALEIPGIGMSVYDFLMGLVYILLVFGVIGILRKNIDRIRLER